MAWSGGAVAGSAAIIAPPVDVLAMSVIGRALWGAIGSFLGVAIVLSFFGGGSALTSFEFGAVAFGAWVLIFVLAHAIGIRGF